MLQESTEPHIVQNILEIFYSSMYDVPEMCNNFKPSMNFFSSIPGKTIEVTYIFNIALFELFHTKIS